jgi:hypothetical protein
VKYQPVVTMVPQRHPMDCGPTTLSMLLGVSYEEALLAFGGVAPKILRGGVWLTEMRRAAEALGAPLKLKRAWDAEDDEGIAQIKCRKAAYHLVVVRRGLFFDTDFSCWEPEDYLKAKQATTGPLLVREDE